MGNNRRPTADRFVGGAENRVQNIIALLKYVAEDNPSREELREWTSPNIGINTEKTFGKHVGFAEQLDLVRVNKEQYSLGSYGKEALLAVEGGEQEVQDVLFDALTMRVKGFRYLLERIEQNPVNIDDEREVLAKPYESGEAPSEGAAAKHYTWLEAIEYIEKDSGEYTLTLQGQAAVSSDSKEQYSLAEREPSPLRKRSETKRKPSTGGRTADIEYVADISYQQERSYSHEELLDTLEEEMEASGYECHESEHSDLLAVREEIVVLVEAKTITPNTALEQIRVGLGQLSEYEYYDILQRERWGAKQSMRCLLLSHAPNGRLEDYLVYLSNSGIEVLWMDEGEIHGPSQDLTE